jgi:nicotinate-nucleotide pyrophosphorylase (carboxylating)
VALPPGLIRRVVREALEEDLGDGDVTTLAVASEGARAGGVLLAKQELVVAGLDVAVTAFRLLDAAVGWEPGCADGERVAPGAVLGRISGRARALLGAERVALNFLQRLSGIATLTRRFVEAVAGTRARIRDTRKTTPLLRFLEKHAVEIGGGVAHRAGLDAAVLVKDNHVRLAGSVGEAARRAVAGAQGLGVEVEVTRLDEVEDALVPGVGMILLDNFTPELARAAVARVAGRVPVEASGGIRLDNVRAFAEAGCDFIAVGALTHSAPAADVSLELEAAR